MVGIFEVDGIGGGGGAGALALIGGGAGAISADVWRVRQYLK